MWNEAVVLEARCAAKALAARGVAKAPAGRGAAKALASGLIAPVAVWACHVVALTAIADLPLLH